MQRARKRRTVRTVINGWKRATGRLPSNGRANFTFSEESRAKISASLRARWQDPEYRARRGKASVSEETRAAISAAMKAKWAEGAYRARNTVNGSHSAERRQKIAAAIKAKWADPDYRTRTTLGIRRAHNITAAAAAQSLPRVAPEDCPHHEGKVAEPDYREQQLAKMKARPGRGQSDANGKPARRRRRATGRGGAARQRSGAGTASEGEDLDVLAGVVDEPDEDEMMLDGDGEEEDDAEAVAWETRRWNQRTMLSQKTRSSWHGVTRSSTLGTIVRPAEHR